MFCAKQNPRALRVLLAVAVLVTTARAQESVIVGLHSKGSAGMSYSQEGANGMASQGLETEFSSDVTGALFRPEFVNFSSSITYGYGRLSLGDFGANTNTLWAGSSTVMFLPSSVYPLTFSYQRTRTGVGQGFGTTSNTDHLALVWELKTDTLPHIMLQWGKDSNWSDVPVGLSASQSRGSHFGVSAFDTYKGWDWNADYQRSSGDSVVALPDGSDNFKQKYDTLRATAFRRYLGTKGSLSLGVDRTGTNWTSNFSDSAVNPSVDGVQLSTNAQTTLKVSDRLNIGSSFNYYRFSTEQFLLSGGSSGAANTVLPPTSGYTVSGYENYKLTDWLWLGNSTAYSATDAAPNPTEQGERYFANTPTVSSSHTWRGLRLSGTYGLQYAVIWTNFENSFSGLYHTGTISAGWSRPWLSLSGATIISRGSGGAIPGSSFDRTDYNFTAESSKFRRLGVLRFQWQRDQQNLLGSTGLIDSTVNAWSVSLLRRRWTVSGGMSDSSGAHLAYGFVVPAWQALPPLIGVPLESDPVHYLFVNGSGQFKGVRIGAAFRRNSFEHLSDSAQAHFDTMEVNAHYQLGRMTFDALYGRYLTGTETLTSNYGSSRYLWRFRIMRTFNWF